GRPARPALAAGALPGADAWPGDTVPGYQADVRVVARLPRGAGARAGVQPEPPGMAQCELRPARRDVLRALFRHDRAARSAHGRGHGRAGGADRAGPAGPVRPGILLAGGAD